MIHSTIAYWFSVLGFLTFIYVCYRLVIFAIKLLKKPKMKEEVPEVLEVPEIIVHEEPKVDLAMLSSDSTGKPFTAMSTLDKEVYSDVYKNMNPEQLPEPKKRRKRKTKPEE